MNVGDVIAGRYRLSDRLGAGGMSVVWRAEDDVLGRDVAVKVLSVDVGSDPDVLRQLHVEARAVAGLRHPNVVGVYDYGETTADGAQLPYVVMELVPGRSLNALLDGGPLPWRVAVLVAAQVAAALAAAHERGIVHRDVKPANVMVAANGVKLVDFGISAAVGELDGSAGLVLGTPAYLAPERIAGGVVRPATDVYALGLLIYLMVAGELPWQASTATEMLRAHWYQDPAPLPDIPDLPDEIVRLCRECLAKQPADRPSAATAAQILFGAAGLPVSSPLSALFDAETPERDRPGVLTSELDATAPRRPPARPLGSLLGGLTSGLPSSLRGRRRVAAGAALAAALVAVPAGAWWVHRADNRTTPAAAAAADADPIRCTVRYTVQDVAGGRSSTAVTLVNDGQDAIDQWRLEFRLPAGQRLIRGSDAQWQQVGADVRAVGSGLAPGRPLTTTVEASYREATTLPAAFTLNGVICRSDLSLRGRANSSPTPTVTRVAHRSSGSSGSSGSRRAAEAQTAPRGAAPEPAHPKDPGPNAPGHGAGAGGPKH